MELNELLTIVVSKQASDLHLATGARPSLRINGEIVPIETMPILTNEHLIYLLKDILTASNKTQLEEHLETDFSFLAPGLARFRVNAFQQNYGLAAVMRAIPLNVLTLAEINAPNSLEAIADIQRGLVLITGPSGSGKSTTLAAIIDHINKNYAKHILTIEDPIEFVHVCQKSLITQRELNRNTHSFPQALRSALRADPDVILIGEMRDLDTIRLALTAAETGHLVFGTLHTNSAAKTIDRIISAFPATEKDIVRSMLSESLRAVISQVLLKALNGKRIVAHEIMLATPSIRNLIRENKIPQMYSVIQTGKQYGMQTLDQCLTELLDKGLISAQEARQKAENKELFK